LWAAVVHRAGHRMAALAAAAARPAARRAIRHPEPALRGDAQPLRDARRAYRAQAYRLVFEGAAGLGRVPRRGQPDRGSGAGQGADARVLRAAAGTAGGVMLSSLRRGRSQARPVAIPDTAALLAALPNPVLALDRGGIVRFVNPAAEQFFGTGAAALCGAPLADLVVPHSPIFTLLDAVGRSGGSIAEYDVVLEGPRIAPRSVTIQGAPAGEGADLLVLTLHERSMADKMDRQLTHRSAARSVTAMAAMLAHEVKNPLSGIRGAAQLLEQDADEAGRELTRLICEETDRIVALVDRMEGFAEHAPIAGAEVNIHEVLDRVRKIAQSGFARHVMLIEEYDPSLPPVPGDRDLLLQVLLNLVKNAAEAVGDTDGEIILRTAYRHGFRLAGQDGARIF